MALDRTARAVIITRLKRVNLGNFGDCKILKQVPGVWELRIDYGPGYRIYFGKQSNAVVILLIGGDSIVKRKISKNPLNFGLIIRNQCNDKK
ncbi:MAG TPA: type II toxin-antitoxin system RelE/ParE family toxin [Candidatus Babeliales bacterium]|jgi:putative addiction module killer protein|nr:type II toxin-antitoxin system RelE/ParE family toxin [Candidatus Babeliales bacterium]